MSELPEDVARGLDAFLAATKAALMDQLVAAALFGSAAEGRFGRSTAMDEGSHG